LISDISQASRVDNEIASHSGELVDLAKLVDSFVQARAATTDTHDLVHKLPDEPVNVVIHDSRIVQVLDNLLANAVSFAPLESAIKIDLKAHNAKGLAVLEFQDKGPGIPPGRLDAVFDRFYSERPSTEAFGQHSGLGLSIARQIVRGHGGDLTASNRDGACFTLTLPLADASQSRH
jgi:two-component system sensor histidine kinase ChvG